MADEARKEAELATRMKGDFLAMMSHELRTPLNAIIGFSKMLVEAELEGEEQEWATIVHDAGSSLLVVVNDVLDFSKIEAGKFSLNIVPFNPHHLALSCSRLMAQAVGEKRAPRLFSTWST